MTTELVRAEPLAANLPDMVRYAEHLADANLLPAQYRQRPANVLYAMEYGRTLGITPLAAITGIHVIEGKPSASAALISGLVRQAGHKLRVTGNSQSATAQIIRSDDPDFVYEVTWELKRNQRGNPSAEDAGLLNKDVWKKYAASMLKARAISQVARDACEEVLFGLHYTPEELDARVDADGVPVDVQVQQLRRVNTAEPDQWATPSSQQTEAQPAESAPRTAQEIADFAKEATDRGRIAQLWSLAKNGRLMTAPITAPDTGEAEELGQYLTRRAKDFAEGITPRTSDEEKAEPAEVLEGEIVTGEEAEHAAAVAEYRQFAAHMQIPNADSEAEQALGIPLANASAASIRDFTNQLRGNAA